MGHVQDKYSIIVTIITPSPYLLLPFCIMLVFIVQIGRYVQCKAKQSGSTLLAPPFVCRDCLPLKKCPQEIFQAGWFKVQHTAEQRQFIMSVFALSFIFVCSERKKYDILKFQHKAWLGHCDFFFKSWKKPSVLESLKWVFDNRATILQSLYV